MPLETRRCLVTGGAGFVGSWWVRHLLAAGHRVTVLDNFATGQPNNIPREARTIAGDATDPVLVDRWVRRSDTVFHLAALGPDFALEEPLTVLTSNVLAALSVIAACAYHNRELVLVSSAAVYGHWPAPVPVTETDAIRLANPPLGPWVYNLTKLLDEALAQTWYRETGLNAKIVRLFPCVGPRQGQAYPRLVPRLIRAALQDRALQIDGDGSQQHSFIYITDAITGIDLVWQRGGKGQVYNVGSGEAVTGKELAERILQLTGSSSTVQYLPAPNLTLATPIPDLQLIHGLGYRSQFTLDDTLRAMITFHQDGN